MEYELSSDQEEDVVTEPITEQPEREIEEVFFIQRRDRLTSVKKPPKAAPLLKTISNKIFKGGWQSNIS